MYMDNRISGIKRAFLPAKGGNNVVKQEFSIGQRIIYGIHGICEICDIKDMSLSSMIPPQPYYILNQIRKSSIIYVPVSNGSKLRNIYNKETIDDIILSSRGKRMGWINDRKQRTTEFRDIITLGFNERMLLMINCIRARKIENFERNKKLSDSDEDMLRTAEYIVNEELSYVLGIAENDVRDYISDMIELKEA